MFNDAAPPAPEGVNECWRPDADTLYTIDLTPMLPPARVAEGHIFRVTFLHQPSAPGPNEWLAFWGGRYVLMPAETVTRLVLTALNGGYRAAKWNWPTIKQQLKYHDQLPD